MNLPNPNHFQDITIHIQGIQIQLTHFFHLLSHLDLNSMGGGLSLFVGSNRWGKKDDGTYGWKDDVPQARKTPSAPSGGSDEYKDYLEGEKRRKAKERKKPVDTTGLNREDREKLKEIERKLKEDDLTPSQRRELENEREDHRNTSDNQTTIHLDTARPYVMSESERRGAIREIEISSGYKSSDRRNMTDEELQEALENERNR